MHALDTGFFGLIIKETEHDKAYVKAVSAGSYRITLLSVQKTGDFAGNAV